MSHAVAVAIDPPRRAQDAEPLPARHARRSTPPSTGRAIRSRRFGRSSTSSRSIRFSASATRAGDVRDAAPGRAGVDMLMPRTFYREALAAGRIEDRDLEATIAATSVMRRWRAMPPRCASQPREIG